MKLTREEAVDFGYQSALDYELLLSEEDYSFQNSGADYYEEYKEAYQEAKYWMNQDK